MTDQTVSWDHSGQSLWIELTPHCNWSCLFCYNPWRPGDRLKYPRALQFDELVQALGRLLGRIEFDYVALSGGEPLLYPRLEDLIKWLSARARYCVLTTNGTLLNRQRMNRLKEAGLASVQVSLMSLDPAKHDRLAGKASWQQAIQGICNATELELNTAVVFTATRLNVSELPKLVHFLSELNVGAVIVNKLQFGGSAVHNAGILQLDHATYIRFLEEANRVGSANQVQVVPVPPLHFDSLPARRPWCRWAVSPGGELKICNLSSTGLGHANEIPDELLDQTIAQLSRGELEAFVDSVDTCSCFERRLSQLG